MPHREHTSNATYHLQFDGDPITACSVISELTVDRFRQSRFFPAEDYNAVECFFLLNFTSLCDPLCAESVGRLLSLYSEYSFRVCTFAGVCIFVFICSQNGPGWDHFMHGI